jgi:NADP-dependent aldehyde dehydrogenase
MKMTTATIPASVAEAAERAKQAAAAFAAMAPADRAAFLDDCAERIEALGDELTQTAMNESHLPKARLEGERARTVNQLKMFATLVREGSWVDARIDAGDPDASPKPKPDVRRMLRPLGPIAVFGASNFPLAFSTAGGDTASALAAACPVVYKAHPGHPATCDRVAGAIAQAVAHAGLPEGVFVLLHTQSNEQNLELVRHPAIKGVGFTGSHKAGRALFDAAAGRPDPIPVFAEMGSVNPVVLLPDALKSNAEALATGLHGSFTLGVGQFCTNPGVVLCLRDAAEPLLDTLASLTEQTAGAAMLHKGIIEGYKSAIEQVSRTGKVKVVARSKPQDPQNQPETLLLKAQASDVLEDSSLLDECFGPSTLIVLAEDLEEIKAVLAKMGGQLTATIHATDADRDAAADLLPLLENLAGRVLFNGFPTGVEVNASMQHGGPYPATTDSRFTSVGTGAILRWARPVCYQDIPDQLLPPALKRANPLKLWRTVDNKLTRDAG